MRTANKVGVVAVVFLALAAVAEFTSLRETGFETVSLVFQWTGIFLLIYSGIKGSRWWFTLPIAIILVWVWALSRGH